MGSTWKCDKGETAERASFVAIGFMSPFGPRRRVAEERIGYGMLYGFGSRSMTEGPERRLDEAEWEPNKNSSTREGINLAYIPN